MFQGVDWGGWTSIECPFWSTVDCFKLFVIFFLPVKNTVNIMRMYSKN